MVHMPLLGHRRLDTFDENPTKKIIQLGILLFISFLAILILFFSRQSDSSSQVVKNNQKIIGGTEADADTEFPYALQLFTYGRFGCGAVIIGETIGLTAAHCVRDQPDPSWYMLRAGNILATDDLSWEQQEQVRRVTKIVIHPDHNVDTVDNDVAIFQVDEPFDFNSRVNKINLPTRPSQFSDKELTGKQLTAIGWGLKAGLQGSDVLKKVKIPFVSKSRCQSQIPKRFYNLVEHRITDSMICAGVPGSRKASCYGDSGGPLVLSEGLPNHHLRGPLLIGLTSWSYFCGEESPGVYANVRFLSAWIHEQTAILLADNVRSSGNQCGDGGGGGHDSFKLVWVGCCLIMTTLSI